MRTCESCDHLMVCAEVKERLNRFKEDGNVNNIAACNHWNGWIQITNRPITEEEREGYGWGEDITAVFTCPLPNNGDEILISRNKGKWISLVTFCDDDYGVVDEDGNDWLYEVEAWRELPKREWGNVKE